MANEKKLLYRITSEFKNHDGYPQYREVPVLAFDELTALQIFKKVHPKDVFKGMSEPQEVLQ